MTLLTHFGLGETRKYWGSISISSQIRRWEAEEAVAESYVREMQVWMCAGLNQRYRQHQDWNGHFATTMCSSRMSYPSSRLKPLHFFICEVCEVHIHRVQKTLFGLGGTRKYWGLGVTRKYWVISISTGGETS